MLLTIFASIGLFFVFAGFYKKGKRDGVKDAIDFFITEMNRRKIDIEIIDDCSNMGKKQKSIVYDKLRYLIGRKK